MLMRKFILLSVVVSASVAIIACSGGDDSAARNDTTAAAAGEQAQPPASTEAISPPAGTGDAAPVTVEDIDRWQRGMEAELAAVKRAGEKLKAARNSNDTLSAMME